MASSFKYTTGGQASGYTYSNGRVGGASPYTVGGRPLGTYTVGGHPLSTGAALQQVVDQAVGGHSFLHSVEDLTTGVLNAFYVPARAAALDVAAHPSSLISGPVAPLTANLESFAEGQGGGHLYKDVAVPIAKNYEYKYGPAFQGHPGVTAHRIAADPLGSFLDLATLVTLPFTEGGSAALRAGGLGRIAAAGDAMRAARTLSYTDELGRVHSAELAGSPNPLTRGIQALGDRVSAKLPAEYLGKDYRGQPAYRQVGFSTEGRVARQELKKVRRTESQFNSSVIQYRRALGKLSEPEQFASAVLSTGVNTDGLLKMWTDSRAALNAQGKEASSLSVRNIDYLSKNKAQIDEIIANSADHPKLLRATQEAHKAANLREKWILETEAAKPGGDAASLAGKLAERKTRQAEVAAGSRFVPEKTLGYTQAQPNYAERRAAYDVATSKPAAGGRITAQEVADQEGANVTHIELRASRDLPYTNPENARQYNLVKGAPIGELIHWDGRGFVTGLRLPEGLRNTRVIKEVNDQLVHEIQKAPINELVPDPNGLTEDGLRVWDSTVRRVQRGRLPGWKVEGDLAMNPSSSGWFGNEPVYEVTGQKIVRTAEGRAAIEKATEDLRTARTQPGAKRVITAPEHWTAPDAARLADVTSGIDPAYGGPNYLPHTTGEQTSRVFRRSGRARQIARQAQRNFPGLSHTEYHRLAMGDMIMHPELLSRAVLRGAAFKGMNVLRDWAATYAHPLNPDAQASEGVDPGMRLFLPHGTSVGQALHHSAEGHALLDTIAGKEDLNALVGEMLPRTREGRGIEALNQAGAKQVPAWVAKRMEKEIHQSTNVLLKIFDGGVDLWRKLVLNYRPAWLVNNIFGQHLLYFMKNLGPIGIRSWVKMLQVEKNPEGRGLQRTYTTALREVPAGEELMFHGASHSLLPSVDAAIRTGKASKLRRALHAVDVGRAMRYANIEYADNASRTASVISLLEKHPEFKPLLMQARGWQGVGGLLKQIAHGGTAIPTKLLGEKTTLKEFIAGLDEHQVRRLTELTDQMLGNFSELSPFERNVLRRIIPFYSWFKVITTLSLRLGLHDPARVNMILNLEKVAKQTGIGVPPFPVPSYLAGSVAVGPQKGGTQPVLSTTGLNPFQTVTQLLQTASSVGGSGGPKFGVSGPLSLLNPGFGMAEQVQGIDPFYGGKYQGPLAGYGYKGRAAAALVTGLPQYRLLEQTKPSLVGSNYKSTLYSNSPTDFWLNFLGVPIKYVRAQEAATRAKAGQ